MAKKQITLQAARKIINETMRKLDEQLYIYYDANSCYFDTHRYDYRLLSHTVKKNGGQNLCIEPVFGMSKQPNMVVFDAYEDMVESIVTQLAKRLGADWVDIREKTGNASKWLGKNLLSKKYGDRMGKLLKTKTQPTVILLIAFCCGRGERTNFG
jgi:hypothetical protein